MYPQEFLGVLLSGTNNISAVVLKTQCFSKTPSKNLTTIVIIRRGGIVSEDVGGV
jgi:hypothetical protein